MAADASKVGAKVEDSSDDDTFPNPYKSKTCFDLKLMKMLPILYIKKPTDGTEFLLTPKEFPLKKKKNCKENSPTLTLMCLLKWPDFITKSSPLLIPKSKVIAFINIRLLEAC